MIETLLWFILKSGFYATAFVFWLIMMTCWAALRFIWKRISANRSRPTAQSAAPHAELVQPAPPTIIVVIQQSPQDYERRADIIDVESMPIERGPPQYHAPGPLFSLADQKPPKPMSQHKMLPPPREKPMEVLRPTHGPQTRNGREVGPDGMTSLERAFSRPVHVPSSSEMAASRQVHHPAGWSNPLPHVQPKHVAEQHQYERINEPNRVVERWTYTRAWFYDTK